MCFVGLTSRQWISLSAMNIIRGEVWKAKKKNLENAGVAYISTHVSLKERDRLTNVLLV
jgi:hypothetical protein